MNKKLFYIPGLLIIVLISYIYVHNPRPIPSGKLAYYAENLNQLTDDSELIIEANVSKEQDELEYSGVTFIKTIIKVKEVLKGDYSLANKEIVLLQTKMDIDPTVKTNGRMLMFLEKYEGPIIDNAYVFKGLYQGNYTIVDDSIIPNKVLKGENSNLKKDINTIGRLSSFKEKLKNK